MQVTANFKMNSRPQGLTELMRMKKLLVLIGICCLQGAMCWSQVAEVKVDLSQAGKKVNPSQFGIFF